MKIYRVEIQFYSPDSIPTSKGIFTIEAQDEAQAVSLVMNDLVDKGYINTEMSLIRVWDVK